MQQTIERKTEGVTKGGILLFILCILYPIRIGEYMGFWVYGTHVALLCCLFAMPGVLFLSSAYQKSGITAAIWMLRSLASVVFLLTCYVLDTSARDVVAFGGTIALTCFYEIGYCIAGSGQFKQFLRYWCACTMVMIGYVWIIVIPIVLKGGVGSLVSNYVGLIRIYVWYWPTNFALYMVMAFWLIIGLASLYRKTYLWLLLLPVLLSLFLTGSRAAIGALALGMGIAVWRNRRKLRLGVLISVLAISLGGYMSFGLKQYTVSNTFLDRSARWSAAIEQWTRRPILGWGFRGFQEVIPTYSWDDTVRQMGSAHNSYIDLLLRGGLLYSVFFWGFILIVVRQGLRLQGDQRRCFEFLSYSIIGLLAAALFHNVFKDPIIMGYFWTYAAGIAFHSRRGRGGASTWLVEKPEPMERVAGSCTT